MRLTIIASDNFVQVDGVGYAGLDISLMPESIHAVQWDTDHGWVEFKDTTDGKPQNQFIESLDMFQFAIDAWEAADYKAKNPPPPEPPSAELNKATASRLLYDTDYTQLPDVNLANKDEFSVYRALLRQIATNPTPGNLVWPVKPTNVWVS